jgi:L-alanine-DL-glutamate epimerase-like enolase superfamily enzyme
MRIKEIREASAHVGSAIRNARLDFSRMTISVVAVVSDIVRGGRPLTGYGFSAVGRYAQGEILRRRFIPRILEADPASLLDETGANLDPARVCARAMSDEKPGGHGDRAVALAALDAAVWDLVAKRAEKPLWQLVAERFNGGRYDERVPVYPGGGYYYPGKGLDSLADEMRGYLDQGYRTVKMKIGGAPLADDLARIEAVLEVVGAGERLAVDANGVFDLDGAIRTGEAIAPLRLMWYEEPGDPLDYALQAALAERYAGAIATGECLLSLADARNLARHAGLRPDRDWLQLDPALCYGPTEYIRIVEMFESHGWSRRRHAPHGGHQLGLNLAAGLQLGGCESYPLVFQPFGGFADAIPVEDGAVRLPDEPGTGIELKADLYRTILDLVGD